MNKWKTLSSRPAFEHRWFKVQQDTVELGNGVVLDDYFYYLHGDVAMVLALTESREIVLTRQYRHALNEFFIELPSGLVDPGESPLEAAKRELMEETGYGAEQFELLAELAPSPGKIKGVWYVYLAQNARRLADVKLEDSEEIEVLPTPVHEVLKMIRTGAMRADTSIAPIYMACDKLGLLAK